MKITSIQKAVIHHVTTDEIDYTINDGNVNYKKYTRRSANIWTVGIGSSRQEWLGNKEVEEMEALFQESRDNAKEIVGA